MAWQYDDTLAAKKTLRKPITYEQFLESELKSVSKMHHLTMDEQKKLAEETADRYFRAFSTYSAKDENDIYVDDSLLLI